jgi:hypothetical protein
MRNNIISYIDMCKREGVSLQRGMNFRLHGGHSVILMSVRPNAPYRDRIEDDGSVLIYEGHDEPRTSNTPEPKRIDQPEYSSSNRLSENGKFHRAAQEFKCGSKPPDIVKVYEKIKKGIWSDNGYFHLIDSWVENDSVRNVFKFKLIAVEDILNEKLSEDIKYKDIKRSRVIPTHVKLEVWKRDEGKCVKCGRVDELHFDHIVPYSKGGTSLKSENIQLLCARHNLEKKANIE